jgi:stringent starvation protein B
MLRAYLIDSTYRWIIDHDFTPYMLVDCSYEGVVFPKNYIGEDDKILLDLSPQAARDLRFSTNDVSFRVTFDGEDLTVFVPFEYILEIYADETKQGLYADEFDYGMIVNEGEQDQICPPHKEEDLDPDIIKLEPF